MNQMLLYSYIYFNLTDLLVFFILYFFLDKQLEMFVQMCMLCFFGWMAMGVQFNHPYLFGSQVMTSQIQIRKRPTSFHGFHTGNRRDITLPDHKSLQTRILIPEQEAQNNQIQQVDQDKNNQNQISSQTKKQVSKSLSTNKLSQGQILDKNKEFLVDDQNSEQSQQQQQETVQNKQQNIKLRSQTEDQDQRMTDGLTFEEIVKNQQDNQEDSENTNASEQENNNQTNSDILSQNMFYIFASILTYVFLRKKALTSDGTPLQSRRQYQANKQYNPQDELSKIYENQPEDIKMGEDDH